jgi:hypothetical protein
MFVVMEVMSRVFVEKSSTFRYYEGEGDEE